MSTPLIGIPQSFHDFGGYGGAGAALGRGLRATATAPDGVTEAVELEGAPVLAVQWELQEEWRIDPRFLTVFEWFVNAARERRNVTRKETSRCRAMN